ncbi:kinetochore scaffold 1 [Girardinichthys multiradiatus]|uniref:kinetochore scaffold 1 n=1 Tax=Girardinichthys multiradiatus TaxID=208333 RepID=UPI001FABBEB0|nr:kinetochore scaffold 1 [Girardinichthys multiradiatus]
MEPLDPGKNVEDSGLSKRRISSILKAPRKSLVFCESEQQENEVESVKPVEKRKSRRVSFAPANDVLLFAKDAKNVSPARCPLQELLGSATATTQNRVDVATEDTSPQIMGIETLLNAPLHASQQRIMVHFDSGNDFGEKTVVFSTDDAVMDITHSHTININMDAELLEDSSHQIYNLLPSEGDGNVTDVFTDVPPSHSIQATNLSSLLTDKKVDSSLERRTISTTLPLLDPGFKNFLSSLSTPSAPSTNTVLTGMKLLTGSSSDETKSPLGQSETQSSYVDKENQVPKPLSSRKTGEALRGSASGPEYDVSMDMTKAQTGCILAADDDDDDPFQCLFPTQEMYEKFERRAPQAREMKKQQSCKSLELNNLKARKSLVNPSVLTPHDSNKVHSVLKTDCTEKTVVFTADEFMDITQSHTGNITSSSLAHPLMSANSLRFTELPASLSKTSQSGENPENPRIQPITAPSSKQTVDFNRSLSQHNMPRNDTDQENCPHSTNRSCREQSSVINPEGNISMDMTEVQTGRISGVPGSDDPFHFLFPSEEIQPLSKSQKKEVFLLGQQNIEGPQSSDHKGLETSSKLSLNMQLQRHQEKVVPAYDYREKTLRFSADDACLDVTQSHTVCIATINMDSHQNINVSPTCGEKTVRFAADDGAMDMTECLTMNIPSNLAPDLITSVRKRDDPLENKFLSSRSLDPAQDNLLTNFLTPNDCDADPMVARMTATAAAESSDGFTVYQEDDMDITEAQTSCILGDEVSMNLTGVQTGRMVVIPQKQETLQAVSPTEAMHGQSVHGKMEGMKHQQCNEAFGASNYAGPYPSMKTSLKTMMQRNLVGFNSNDDCRERTVRFAADDGCMDVTQCNTVNISSDLPLNPQFNVALPGNEERTVRVNANDAAIGLARSHTVDIADDLNVLIHKKVDLLPADGERTLRFSADGAEMDMTKSHTVNIGDLPLQFFPNMVMPSNGEKTVRFGTNDAAMDMTRSHTVKISSDLKMLSHQNENLLPASGEKTLRFTSNDATMDETRSHTVNIAHDLNLLAHHKVDVLPADGERTLRFSADGAEMDMTKSHTVQIRDLPLQFLPNMVMPSNGEKTVRFTSNDATMDMTRSHTVKISSDLKMLSHQNENLLPASGEKTLRFTSNDATMDETRSHTVSIAHDLNLLAHHKVDVLPADSERAVRFGVDEAEMDVTKNLTVKIPANAGQIVNLPATKENQAWLTTNDTTMDVTRSHTVSIFTDFDQESNQIKDSLPANTEGINNALVDKTGSDTESILKNYKLVPHHNVEFLPTSGGKTSRFTTNDATMDMTHFLSVKIVSDQLLNSVISDQNTPSMHENMNNTLALKETDGNCVLDSNPSLSAQSEHAALNNSLFQKSCSQGNLKGDASLCPDSNYSCLKTKEPDTDVRNESPSLVSDDIGKLINKTNTEEISASMDMSEDQTERLASSTDNPPQGVSSKQDPHSKSFKESDLTLQSSEALGSSVSDELENTKEYQPKAETQAASQKMEGSPSTADQNTDVLPSQFCRQRTLTNLQSKLRRLSHLINVAAADTAMESCTAPLPHVESDLDKNSNGKTSSPSGVKPVLGMGLGNDTNDTEAQNPTKAELPSVGISTPPFSLKPKQLKSRLSVIGFKPKLPKRNNADELKKSVFEGEPTKTFTVSVTNQLSRFDQIRDIHDEELVDCEDFSETIDTMTPEKIPGKERTSNQFSTPQLLEDDEFLGDFMFCSPTHKRSLPENEDDREDEKRQKMCTEFAETALQPDDDCDSNTATTRTQTIVSSNRHHTGTTCEKKLEDGTITVLEFFNLFSIDFVIHNPRHSVLPGRLLADTDTTPLDLLKDKYISRPKQTVYEKDVQTLTEQMEGRKYRMQDLNKPLKTVNRSVWEEVKHFTEKELKSFGAKLKERNNFFRKKSKVQSHEMKEVLYGNLVLTNLEEQQKLMGTIDQADEMIQSLDGCIGELEAELDAVEEKGAEDTPGLKSLQEEMSKVTATLADNNRQISELDLGKKKNSSDLNRLIAETRNLQSHIDMLMTVNEWRLEEKDDENKDNCSVYTFLHRTLFLWLVYEKTNGNDADSRSGKKITTISFKFNLNDGKSQSHASLVHKLVSQYIEGEASWVEKYPTIRHVPQLLHDVSLVVSRCRLVGEELRLLKMWGGLRFDILDISCSETQVHVVFSSLKKCCKFEVVFTARLTNQLCVFHVQSFKNLIGSTTIQQIEDIVASLSPGKNLFTKIIKKLHGTLLS